MTSPEVEAVLARGDAASERAARWLRDLLLGAGLGLTEGARPRWGSVNFRHPVAGYVAGIFPKDGHALLVIEHGAFLDGFDDVFDGGGKQIRTIEVRDAPDPRADRIVDAVLAEIALRAAP